MNPIIPPQTLAILIFGAAAWLAAVYFVDRSLEGMAQTAFRTFAIAVSTAAFFFGLRYIDNHDIAVNVAKGGIAFIAAACVFFESWRQGRKKPIAERWKKFVGLTLAVAALTCYFHGFRFGYGHYFHRWDQFHYYMGAKYFREMGYDGLYKCAVIAQDELGTVELEEGDDADFPNHLPLDLSKEARHGDKKIRNLGGDNLLIPAADVLAQPDAMCKKSFTPERWEVFKRDVRYFRLSSDKTYWEDMQKDHGYNPPPVWTVMGHLFANLHPANMRYLQFLAGLDILYLIGTFAGLYWAFGWRVFSVAAIFFGCQASAPFYWTGGAFLRQDWLFFLVMAACLARKQYFKLSGAAMVYAGLLRVFPGLCVIGWLFVVGWNIYKKHRLEKRHKQMLVGGVLAAALLIPASVYVAGNDSYQQFYKHTLQVHDRTPLTNHMGLRVLISHNIIGEASSGRMKYTKDVKLTDPFEVWKRMRNDRYDKYKYIGYAFVGLVMVFFGYITRRIKNMWVAQCLAQVFIMLMSQLTCYYYSFMILTAPLIRIRKDIEAPLFGLALLTQVLSGAFGYIDDEYTALSAVSLMFALGLLCAVAPPELWAKVRERFRREPVAS